MSPHSVCITTVTTVHTAIAATPAALEVHTSSSAFVDLTRPIRTRTATTGPCRRGPVAPGTDYRQPTSTTAEASGERR